MWYLLILCLFAAAQADIGIDYRQKHQLSSSTLAAPQATYFTVGSDSLSGGNQYYVHEGATHHVGQPHQSTFSTFSSGGSKAGSLHSSRESVHSTQHSQHAPIVTKNFYYYSTEEESISKDISSKIQIGTPREHYNVVFIKAPEKSVQSTAAQIFQAAQNEKTVVYVLAKENDETEIRASIKDIDLIPHKPEVHFIKYNTPEEADVAKQNIIKKYNEQGGISSSSNDRILQIESVAQRIGHSSGSHATHHQTGSVSSLTNIIKSPALSSFPTITTPAVQFHRSGALPGSAVVAPQAADITPRFESTTLNGKDNKFIVPPAPIISTTTSHFGASRPLTGNSGFSFGGQAKPSIPVVPSFSHTTSRFGSTTSNTNGFSTTAVKDTNFDKPLAPISSTTTSHFGGSRPLTGNSGFNFGGQAKPSIPAIPSFSHTTSRFGSTTSNTNGFSTTAVKDTKVDKPLAPISSTTTSHFGASQPFIGSSGFNFGGQAKPSIPAVTSFSHTTTRFGSTTSNTDGVSTTAVKDAKFDEPAAPISLTTTTNFGSSKPSIASSTFNVGGLINPLGLAAPSVAQTETQVGSTTSGINETLKTIEEYNLDIVHPLEDHKATITTTTQFESSKPSTDEAAQNFGTSIETSTAAVPLSENPKIEISQKDTTNEPANFITTTPDSILTNFDVSEPINIVTSDDSTADVSFETNKAINTESSSFSAISNPGNSDVTSSIISNIEFEADKSSQNTFDSATSTQGIKADVVDDSKIENYEPFNGAAPVAILDNVSVVDSTDDVIELNKGDLFLDSLTIAEDSKASDTTTGDSEDASHLDISEKETETLAPKVSFVGPLFSESKTDTDELPLNSAEVIKDTTTQIEENNQSNDDSFWNFNTSPSTDTVDTVKENKITTTRFGDSDLTNGDIQVKVDNVHSDQSSDKSSTYSAEALHSADLSNLNANENNDESSVNSNTIDISTNEINGLYKFVLNKAENKENGDSVQDEIISENNSDDAVSLDSNANAKSKTTTTTPNIGHCCG